MLVCLVAVQVLARTGSLNGSLSAGFLSGEAREREYEPEEGGHKVSQLKLKYNSVPVIRMTNAAC
ncbi:omptin family outer membrane protease [Salmonella enterica]|uniref:Uncharacterized protein n=1 Tax=Salmonella enterica subsp. salamae TaxID=59202 RepID=A0A5Y3XDJ4_SALER|nr:omptin family outer membrane protease [Salmonella enterica]ECE5745022.1 hypothetical protein [Salmonella enterica subsp. salamae]EDR6299015.1 omptin family outer membrane protease [Salmonella enterica subsp. enterica serovar Berkeley]EAR7074055.1 omptin family outer membrane protease [Salmonella enterica]ECE2104446.1 omptin family outer membrane protease [Salmonella enterica]